MQAAPAAAAAAAAAAGSSSSSRRLIAAQRQLQQPKQQQPLLRLPPLAAVPLAWQHRGAAHQQQQQPLMPAALLAAHQQQQQQQQQQQLQQPPLCSRSARAAIIAAATGGTGGSSSSSSSSGSSGGGADKDNPNAPPSREDRANPNKADFSAYWSLKFREFFSKRRGYLRLARQQAEQPALLKKLDAAIARQEERVEAGRIAARRRTLERIEASPELQAKAAERDQQLVGDAGRALASLHAPRTKLVALTALRLRAGIKALLLLPLTLPAAAAARWRALFAGPGYEQFLLSEGERVWAWRNRTENERWFWEVLAVDRLLVPVLWTLCYQFVVPNHLFWAVFVPLCLITWQNGQVAGPGQLEWWLIMFVGGYLKCWDQVCWLAATLLRWG